MTGHKPAAPVRLTFFSDAEYFGGAEEYLVLLARHLDRDSFTPDVVLPDTPGAKVLEERMQAAGVPVRHLRRLGLAWRSRLPEAVRALRGTGGEVLHLNLPSPYDGGVSAVAWAARRAGYRRVVSTEHLPMVDRKYRQFPVKYVFSEGIDRVIVNTRSNRDYLVRLHGVDPEKIRIVDNGVEETPPYEPAERAALRRSWGADDRTAVIGIVGRLTRRKGHHFLLESLEGLARQAAVPAWRLVVAGDGEEAESLRARGDRLHRAGLLHWLGHRDDARRLMHAFDLLVLPSTVETMPFAILEGMAARLPVVASAIFGIPELVVDGETGYLLPPGDVPALRDALQRLLHDPARRSAMGAKGRARFEGRFTARGMAEATAGILGGGDGA